MPLGDTDLVTKAIAAPNIFYWYIAVSNDTSKVASTVEFEVPGAREDCTYLTIDLFNIPGAVVTVPASEEHSVSFKGLNR